MTLPPAIIDTHCHLDFSEFDLDRDQVLAHCREQNVRNIIVPGVTANTWQRTLNLTDSFSQLHPALGLHPQFTEQHQPQHLTQLDNLLSQHRPIAVGEIGLDHYDTQQDPVLIEKQTVFFTKQLIIAKHHDLPVIIHNRKAHDLCFKLLAESPVRGGIIHAFNGSIQHAEKYQQLDFMLGFGGMLTFARSSKLRSLVKALPLSTIVLETDAPDMTVEAHRGERNSPAYLPYVLNAVADIKAVSVDEVARVTTHNAQRVFNLV